MLSPSARSVLEKKLYRKVKTNPKKMICKYSVVRDKILASACIKIRIGLANRIHAVDKINEKITPESMVVLIWRCSVS